MADTRRYEALIDRVVGRVCAEAGLPRGLLDAAAAEPRAMLEARRVRLDVARERAAVRVQRLAASFAGFRRDG